MLQHMLGDQSSAREWVASSKMKPPKIHVPGRDRAKPDPSVASVLSTKRNPILKMHQSKTWFQRKADFARQRDLAHDDGADERDPGVSSPGAASPGARSPGAATLGSVRK